MKGTYLGEFEELVLLTTAVIQQQGAYGNSVLDEIEVRSDRRVNLSAVHSALHRLEKKGFLKSYKGESSGVRGGKRKKLYSITPYGVKALDDIREMRQDLWASIPSVVIDSVK